MGFSETFNALRAALSRRESFVINVDKSAETETDCSSPAPILNSPSTSPVRPTAVILPIRANSSFILKPTKDPDASSNVKLPESESMTHVPSVDKSWPTTSLVSRDATAASSDTSSGAFEITLQTPYAAMAPMTITRAAVVRTMRRFFKASP